MKYMMKGIAVILLFAFTAPLLASADTVCLKSIIRKGKIKNSTKTVASGKKCPKGFTSILSTQALAQSAELQGAQGPQGPKGDTGLTGPQGPAGSVAISSFQIETADSSAVDSSPIKTLFVSCPAGFQLLSCSGGVDNGSFDTARRVAFSYSGATRVGNCFFRAFEIDTETSSWRIFGVATCVPNQ